MLGMKSYPREYVDAVRARVASDGSCPAGQSAPRARVPADTEAFATNGASAAVGQVFFRNLFFGLELSFVHRLRTLEGKDGNPLNEVRVVCNSLLLHDGVLTADKGIKVDPARSVLGVAYGERVVLDAASFGRLADAFFTELEARFV